MKLYRTRQGTILEQEGKYYRLEEPCWDDWLARDRLFEELSSLLPQLDPLPQFDVEEAGLLAPVGSQEIWAAGVTYYRSRQARMEESEKAKGSDFYDRVYQAERPELFFKSSPHRVVGHGQKIRIRRDSRWNVPEPELTLLVSPRGSITGYTVGNDVSSRDIEGENPLYLPQAKVYDQSCALGPGILVRNEPLSPCTEITLEIERDGSCAFHGSTTLSELKRKPETLVEYLFRDNSFPWGCFLMTGTGIIPPATFTLQPGDEVRIQIGSIGTLVNQVEQR